MSCREKEVNTVNQMKEYKKKFPPTWWVRTEEDFCFKAELIRNRNVIYIVKVKNQNCSFRC